MRPPEVFVRPLLHEEAVRLKRLSKRANPERAVTAAPPLGGGAETSG